MTKIDPSIVHRLSFGQSLRPIAVWRRYAWPSRLLASVLRVPFEQVVLFLFLRQHRLLQSSKAHVNMLNLLHEHSRVPGPPLHAQVEGFRHFCPACGAPTLDERLSHDICAVCWWEDDMTVGDMLHEASSANHGATLAEHRRRIEEEGLAFPEYEVEYDDAGEVVRVLAHDPNRLAAKRDLIGYGVELRGGPLSPERRDFLERAVPAALDRLSPLRVAGNP